MNFFKKMEKVDCLLNNQKFAVALEELATIDNTAYWLNHIAILSAIFEVFRVYNLFKVYELV